MSSDYHAYEVFQVFPVFSENSRVSAVGNLLYKNLHCHDLAD